MNEKYGEKYNDFGLSIEVWIVTWINLLRVYNDLLKLSVKKIASAKKRQK